jgi:hypothetical protein
MNKVAFYGGLILLVVGLLVWIFRPNQSPQKSEIDLFGAKFKFDTPAFAVMIIGLALMVFSPKFPEYFTSSPPALVKKIVCTGEKEENCPGVHELFFLCGYFGTDQQIAESICESDKPGHVRLKTTDGNRCGYSLIEVTCHPDH